MTLPTLVKDLLRSDFTIPFGTDKNGNAIRATIDTQDLEATDSLIDQFKKLGDKGLPQLADMALIFRPLITHLTVTNPETEKQVRYKVKLSKADTTELCKNAGAIGLADALNQALPLLGVVTGEPQADRVPDPTESSE